MTVDLTTRYLGLELKSPLAASAGPATGDVESLQRLEQAGAGLVVLPSLFQEQVEHDQWAVHRLYQHGSESFGEALDYFPELDGYNAGVDEYLRRIEEANSVLSIPIVASLNGSSKAGWQSFAAQMADAGADALEINIYHVPADQDMSSADVEERYVELVAAVREAISIPLAVKIGPFFTSLPQLANRLVGAGAQGLVLFNRYLEPDIDLETLEVKPTLQLSLPSELRLPLRWIAILRGKVQASLALTSGVHNTSDALKALLAGADLVMMQSALLQRGPAHLQTMLQEMDAWLTEHEYTSVRQMQGSMSRGNVDNPSAYERASYVRALVSFSGRQDE